MQRSKMAVVGSCAVVGIALLIAFLPQSAPSSEKETKPFTGNFRVAPGTNLEVSGIGSVHISSWDQNVVDVKVVAVGEKEMVEEFNVDIRQSGPTVMVETEFEGNDWGDGEISVEYTIRTPRNINVRVQTAGGGIEMQELEGEARLESAGGSIALLDVNGAVEAEAAGGNIQCSESQGDFDLQSAGGEISVAMLKGSITAKSAGGSINFDNVEGYVRAKSAGGKIAGKVVGSFEGAELSAVGGSITLSMPMSAQADIDATTFGGDIHLDMGDAFQGTYSEDEAEGKINGGGKRLALQTVGGSITLRANK